MEVLLGTPPPPAPPNVPALPENSDARTGQRAPNSNLGARAHGGAPREPGLRVVPQDDGPDRIRAGEFRCRGRLAHQRQRLADRCVGPDVRRGEAGRSGQPAAGDSEPLRLVHRRPSPRICWPTAWAACWSITTCRWCGPSIATRRATTIAFLVIRPGHRQEPPFQMRRAEEPRAVHRPRHGAARTRSEGRIMQYITKKHLSRRTVLRGMGATLALPLLDSMVPAQTPLSKTAAAVPRRAWRASKWCTAPPAAPWKAPTSIIGRPKKRAPISSSARHLEPPRAVSRLPHHRQRHGPESRHRAFAGRRRRRPFPLQRRVPDRRASQDDRGLGLLCGHVDRSDLRAEVRPGHAAAFDPALHRDGGRLGRLRLRLCLRVRRHHQLGVADAAAAHDPRPAHGVRESVRRWRHAGGAAGPRQGESQHPGLDLARRGALAEGPRAQRPHAG